MNISSTKLGNRNLSAKGLLKSKELLREAYEQGISLKISDCDICKNAIHISNGTYCGKFREDVVNIISCLHFDHEPVEYRLYRRS